MKKLEIDDIKQREMQILDFFDSLCNKYSLPYSIAAGTLLGAVRHKGFIPWDDDIDVFMFRNDYEKLLSIVKEHEFEYKSLIPFSKGNYLTFLKLIDSETEAVQTDYDVNVPGLGVWIDILPLDNLPDGKEEAQKLLRRARFWQLIRNAGIHKKPKNVRQLPFWLMSKLFPPVIAAKHMSEICRTYENNDTNRVGLIVYDTNNKRFIFEKRLLCAYTRIPFEDRMYQSYDNYDYVLTASYGDYMKLPPIEEQVGKHAIEAWLKDAKEK